jgi:hypothetical protein
MDNEQINKMMDDSYDNSKEEGLISMLRDFYSRKTLSIAIFTWIWGIIFTVGAIYSGIEFCRLAEDKRFIYGLVFIACMHGISIMKIFAWQMIHKNSIKREIKRLELRIVELSQIVQKK